MYCSTCGTQLQKDLNYCNRCGNRVQREGSNASSAAENLSTAVGYVGGFGLLAFIFIMLIVLKKGAASELILPISALYLATLFGICYLLIRQAGILAKHQPDDKRSIGPGENGRPADEPVYLRPVTTAQLEEHRGDGIGSITESTTRTLDKVPVEHK